ncbi:helix-turn-helix domain-containing protein [Shewanella eurypsychrophilus]|uniref:Helix-turn-helix domain-containing protein n=1 Tax=Shewanella eurypsychrophilus TaxID=2593656 RepID=A0ABX6V8Q6_9GAMM|nr:MULTISPECIES: AraC family transcriptional regulator [Shewanella]QFU23807.1 helix-turn-helix domain-containing protein [Shewanella sp. YLB-09]QPG59030.1 helix-turn-helix domain-containing protein [Shewanella eurypsychrophilus]
MLSAHSVQQRSANLVPLFKSEYTITLVNLLKRIDKNIYPLISMVGLPDNILEGKHTYVPEAPVINLLELLYEKSGQKKFGELIWYACRNVFIPRYISHIKQACTLKEAIKAFISYMHHESTHTHIQLRSLVGKTWFIRDRKQTMEHSHHLAEQFALIFMVELVRGLTRSDWSPKDVVMKYDNRQALKEALMLKSTGFYTERSICAISFSDEEIEQKVNLKSSWDRDETKTTTPTAPVNFLHSFKDAISPYISMGKIPITQAALILNMSVRTLQRRLADEKASYSEVVAEIIYGQAISLMSDKGIPVTRISSTLGYSDVSHFSRAFKRMTGQSPRAYRKSLA